MSEPRRFLQDANPKDELARTMLRTGRPKAPHTARRRAIVGAMTAVTTTSLSTSATAVGSIAAKIGVAAVVKWIGIAMVVGASAVGVAAFRERIRARSHPVPHVKINLSHAEFSPAPLATGRPALAPTTSIPTATLSPVATSSVVAPPTITATSAPTAPTLSSTNDSIGDQVMLLRRASAALDIGDTAKALSILDVYDVRFHHASLTQEAAVLRIEALAHAGDSSAARRAAEAFIKANPASPYAPRVRSVALTNP